MEPKITQKSTSRPVAPPRASREPFWSHFGSTLAFKALFANLLHPSGPQKSCCYCSKTMNSQKTWNARHGPQITEKVHFWPTVQAICSVLRRPLANILFFFTPRDPKMLVVTTAKPWFLKKRTTRAKTKKYSKRQFLSNTPANMLRVAGAIWPILGFFLLRCNPRDLKNSVLAVAKPRFLKKRAARAKSKQKSIDHKKGVLAVVKSNISQKQTTRAKSQKQTVDLKNRILTIMKTMISKKRTAPFAK